MKALNLFFLLCIVASSLVCIAIYALLFESMSETAMLQLSYFWVFFLVMGIAGLILKKHKKRVMLAALWGFTALVCLASFFLFIWPSL